MQELQKTYYEDNRLMETTDYSGMFVYKADHIDYINTSEGRLKWSDKDRVFYAEYFIKDHLGNVRSVISSDPYPPFIRQATDYYPFGLEIPVYEASDNQTKYNSKELQTEADLDWYDYGARFYNPVLGSWHVIDPMAEKSSRFSPYTYCMNNPIRFIDPDGRSEDWFQNENTGDVSYNSQLHKGDEKTLGEGWIYLGENGMFSDGTPMTTDINLLGFNQSLTNLKINEDGSINATGYMEREKAEKFMKEQGYLLMPTQQTIYNYECTSRFPTSPGRELNITTGEEIRITEKQAYLASENIEIGRYNLTKVISSTNLISSKKVSRYHIIYSDNSWKKFTTNLINLYKPFSGTHDFRMIKPYENWNQYQGNNNMILNFKDMYGKE